jgi:mitochondrial distribution and morphology protein 34
VLSRQQAIRSLIHMQANPLNHRKNEMSDLLGGSSGILAAHQPLVVPMLLRLSQFRLNSYVVLVLSKQKGCTLVFKTDPLQNVEVSSTFDSIAVIQSFIQREIEDQLREMFREDLPSIIHRLSQRWVAGQTRVEAPYLRAPVSAPLPRPKSSSVTASRRYGGTSSVSSSRRGRRDEEEPVTAAGMLPRGGVGLHPELHSRHAFGRPGSSPSVFRSRSSAPGSYAPPSSFDPASDKASARSGSKTPLSSDFPTNPQSSLPDIENFDPTYGLRPEGPPTRSSYSGLGKLFETSKGLRELAPERPSLLHDELVADIDEESTYDVPDWEGEHHRVAYEDIDDVDDEVSQQEYVDMETIPAVGGGFITRPRIHQSQSSIDPPPSIPPPQEYDHAIRGTNAPRFPKAQSDRYEGPGRARARRTVAPLHRDRGIGMDASMEGDEQAHNPYFSDIYRRRPSVGSANAELEDENGGTSSRFNMPRRATGSTSRSIPIGSPSSAPRWSSMDRSVSRSPPTGEYFQYGSPSRRQSQFAGSPDDPDHEFGNYIGPNSEFNPRSSRGIILRNQSVSQLTALSRSNQTLSPYTRSFSHFTVRSGPPKPFISNTTPLTSSAKSGPRKATRKRIHRLYGGDNVEARKLNQRDSDAHGVVNERGGNDGDLSLDRLSYSPRPPSEFSDEDVEHYFRTRRPSEVVHSPMRADRHLHSE